MPLLIVVLSFLSWLGPARLVRGETLSLRTREFVDAVRVAGGRNSRIVGRHIIPNTLGTISVNATFQVADAIIILATLSFLGFGLPPPAVSWGGMLSQGTHLPARRLLVGGLPGRPHRDGDGGGVQLRR